MPLSGPPSLEGLSPARLWPLLDADTRLAAARSLYAHEWGSGTAKREADQAIAQRMRFREQAVRKLPVERRARYLSQGMQPAESLAQSLLLALHLEGRRPMLARFLGRLGIPNDDGLIDEDHAPEPPPPEALDAAVRTLRDEFPRDEVDVYLLTLLAMDPETWSGLTGVLR